MPSKLHNSLCERAVTFLRNKGCGLVLKEPGAWAIREMPDAIGWLIDGTSMLVECKVSVRDFKADAAKISKVLDLPLMGVYRWYMTPKGLLQKEDMPKGYGLLEVSSSGQLREVRQPAEQDRGRAAIAELPLAINRARTVGWDILHAGGVRGRIRCIEMEG